ncbi:hypothetical protein I4F81_007227 [Pyropia yezoensis]|uniref:Uncharacterized protein n=1 Tax=Pyropia yezoensis TaxID=2788 RepID=A0ACC3C3K5_PYRYE|nr:hypothetical protein I4F81_007227 [Neopyropia yezoensis]
MYCTYMPAIPGSIGVTPRTRWLRRLRHPLVQTDSLPPVGEERGRRGTPRRTARRSPTEQAADTGGVNGEKRWRHAGAVGTATAGADAPRRPPPPPTNAEAGREKRLGGAVGLGGGPDAVLVFPL